MHPLLSRLFEKRKIDGIDDLKPEEKVDFDRWQRVLSEGEMSVASIEKFCEYQVSLIESQWKNTENSSQKNDRLIQTYNVYKGILDCIKAPQAEKEALERYLNSLLS